MTCQNPHCGKEIDHPRKGRRFCSSKCRFAYHNTFKNKALSFDLIELLKKHHVLDYALAGAEKSKERPWPNQS